MELLRFLSVSVKCLESKDRDHAEWNGELDSVKLGMGVENWLTCDLGIVRRRLFFFFSLLSVY